jgi:NAD(P)-dependent dehydrogenase (short-subunit alcohol dehydrogenase family)
MQLDLSSLQSVHTFTTKFVEKFERLDHLVLNAGISGFHNSGFITKDGIETVFATNHLGHFKLYKDVAHLIEATAKSHGFATVTVVSSASHFQPPPVGVYLTLEGLNDPKTSGSLHYGQSKLANVLFAQEISARMQKAGKNVFANSLHPGFVDTNILKSLLDATNDWTPFWKNIVTRFTTLVRTQVMWTSEDGSLTQVYLAVSSDVPQQRITGKYFHPIAQEVTPNPKFCKNETLQRGLWEFSEQLLAERGF